MLELCAGVDVLIHDAQFTDIEYMHKSDWGHCTVDYAVEVAAQAGRGAWCCSTTILPIATR